LAKHHRHRKKGNDVPPAIAPAVDAPLITTANGSFNLGDPVLPDWIERRALTSAGFPYDAAIADKTYEKELTLLQIELVKLQRHVNQTGAHGGGVRGARRGRQGQHHLRRAPLHEPAHGTVGGARPADRARAGASGTPSATRNTCRRRGNWPCSTDPGTTAPASSP